MKYLFSCWIRSELALWHVATFTHTKQRWSHCSCLSWNKSLKWKEPLHFLLQTSYFSNCPLHVFFKAVLLKHSQAFFKTWNLSPKAKFHLEKNSSTKFAPFASVLVSVLNPAVNFQMNEYELPNFYDYFLHICLFLKN